MEVCTVGGGVPGDGSHRATNVVVAAGATPTTEISIAGASSCALDALNDLYGWNDAFAVNHYAGALWSPVLVLGHDGSTPGG